MTEQVIYNCHTHIFTHQNVPNRFFPLFLVPAARITPIRWGLRGLMKGIIPWSKNDKIHRFDAFIKAAYRKTQEKNLEHLIGYYPKGTKFVILPMDMEFMGAGKVKEKIDHQHEELANLARSQQYKDILIPFAHIDPRNGDPLARLKTLVEQDNFKGVKIYPPLGYAPDHKVLMDEIYPYMLEKNIPLMAHCSPGSVNSKKMKKKEAQALADPYNYKKVMDTYPKLKICLGHFGGIGEWERHLNQARNIENPTWLTKILDLMTCGKYPNLYTDISYTIFNFEDNAPLLKVLLADSDVLSNVLFGSDFYMVESEKFSEKRLSVKLRSELDEDKFWKIANENLKKYLLGKPLTID